MADAVFVQQGIAIDYTPSSDVAYGDVVVQAELVGVAKSAIASGVLGSLDISGVFLVKKDESTAMPVGTIVYWDVADSELQTDAASGANKKFGKVVRAALSADTHVEAMLIN